VWEQNSGLANPNLLNYQDVFPKYGLDITNSNTRTLLNSTIGSTTVKNAGFTAPYVGYPSNQTLASVLLRPFPQYSSVGLRWSPLGKSWYDSLQVKVTKRYSHGLDLTLAYTRSKTLSYGPVNDIFNRENAKALSGSDRPNILTLGFNYNTPKVRGNHWVQAIVGEWTIGGLFTYSSGSLIGTPGSNNQLAQSILQGTRMNRVAGVSPFLKDLNCHCINPDVDLVFNPAAWQDAPAGQWGYGAPFYTDYRNQRRPVEQLSVGRNFRIKEKMNLQVRAEVFNAFNRLQLPDAGGSPTTSRVVNAAGQLTAGFGFINKTATSGQRNGQLVARFTF
jgi:hypothetical protein